MHMKVPKGSPLLGGRGASSSSNPSSYPPAPHASAVPLTGMDETLHLRVAVCNGLANAKKLLNAVKEGKAPPYDFVECMACPQGASAAAGSRGLRIKTRLLQGRRLSILSTSAQR